MIILGTYQKINLAVLLLMLPYSKDSQDITRGRIKMRQTRRNEKPGGILRKNAATEN
jgi:hypothetical protein